MDLFLEKSGAEGPDGMHHRSHMQDTYTTDSSLKRMDPHCQTVYHTPCTPPIHRVYTPSPIPALSRATVSLSRP
ncbi:1495_t:CDS:2, partial [Acaulospora morrowiae]